MPRVYGVGADAPRWAGGPLLLTCEVCGGKVRRKRAPSKQYKHVTCSATCRRALVSRLQQREMNPNWKGGRYMSDGYVMLRIGSRTVFEHRLVMEQTLGRPLLDTEVVHHINGIRDDNRPENLMVLTRATHVEHHPKLKTVTVCRLCGAPERCKGLCRRHYAQHVYRSSKTTELTT